MFPRGGNFMVQQRPYVKQIFPLVPGQWTPVVAPIDCNVFWIKATDQAIRESSDAAPDGTSLYEVIVPGELQYLPNYLVGPGMGWTRFKAGDLITNLMADSGNTNAVVTFVL